MCIIKLECFPEIVKHWTAVFATQGEILLYLIIQIFEVGKINHVWDDISPPLQKYMHCLSVYKIPTNWEQFQIQVYIFQCFESPVSTLYTKTQQPNFTAIVGHLSTYST